MKIATQEDIEELVAMAMKFIMSTAYAPYASEEQMRNIITNVVTGDQREKIALLKSGEGMLIGITTPALFGPHMLASELAWYVDPEKRGNKVGVELVEAFEYWAKNVAGCSLISLTAIDDKVGKFYEKRGYKLYEQAYMLEL